MEEYRLEINSVFFGTENSKLYMGLNKTGRDGSWERWVHGVLEIQGHRENIIKKEVISRGPRQRQRAQEGGGDHKASQQSQLRH